MEKNGIVTLPSGYKFLGVPSTDIDEVWYMVEKYVADGLSYGFDTHWPEDVYKAIRDQIFQLWIAVDNDGAIAGCLVTEIQNHPRKTILFLVLIGGHDSMSWRDAWPVVERWAKSKGCTGCTSSLARPGIARLFKPLGFTNIASVIGKDFDGPTLH